ncbi:MAG TPA: hypothetical protein VEF34_04295 [Syntrophobacteraceae bacterium]|nr:hypothetical protein [Syntrophobacteraceae bacterium]
MPALPAFFDECGIAANILRVPLAILFLVLSPGSIVLFLLLVNTPKVIRMLRPPLFVGSTFLFSATLLAAAG